MEGVPSFLNCARSGLRIFLGGERGGSNHRGGGVSKFFYIVRRGFSKNNLNCVKLLEICFSHLRDWPSSIYDSNDNDSRVKVTRFARNRSKCRSSVLVRAGFVLSRWSISEMSLPNPRRTRCFVNKGEEQSILSFLVNDQTPRYHLHFPSSRSQVFDGSGK